MPNLDTSLSLWDILTPLGRPPLLVDPRHHINGREFLATLANDIDGHKMLRITLCARLHTFLKLQYVAIPPHLPYAI